MPRLWRLFDLGANEESNQDAEKEIVWAHGLIAFAESDPSQAHGGFALGSAKVGADSPLLRRGVGP